MVYKLFDLVKVGRITPLNEHGPLKFIRKMLSILNPIVEKYPTHVRLLTFVY